MKQPKPKLVPINKEDKRKAKIMQKILDYTWNKFFESQSNQSLKNHIIFGRSIGADTSSLEEVLRRRLKKGIDKSDTI